ncbi:hypothetical protein [Paraburkholderia eburnea]|uniref:hypothetical protein n=1 Tax=Paraburkholderia eburnea TaxID=1189126 RepID=UPI0011B0593A|nr:hypothetical protein [Paraburkholderia eburnea]
MPDLPPNVPLKACLLTRSFMRPPSLSRNTLDLLRPFAKSGQVNARDKLNSSDHFNIGRRIVTQALQAEARRKTYSMNRLRKAMGRLMGADAPDEHRAAMHWVNAWSGMIGERQIAQLVADRNNH